MLSRILNAMKNQGTSAAKGKGSIDLSRAVEASSDGEAHLEGSMFSVVIDGTEYEWEVEPLYRRAERGDFKIKQYEIPDKFRRSWYWGDTSVEDHVSRALKADFSYPIMVWDGQIVDGTHRCCLALAAGLTHIKAYEIEDMPPYDRTYKSRPEHRSPNDPKRTHDHVVREVNGYMFTPLPIQVVEPLDPNNIDDGREDP